MSPVLGVLSRWDCNKIKPSKSCFVHVTDGCSCSFHSAENTLWFSCCNWQRGECSKTFGTVSVLQTSWREASSCCPYLSCLFGLLPPLNCVCIVNSLLISCSDGPSKDQWLAAGFNAVWNKCWKPGINPIRDNAFFWVGPKRSFRWVHCTVRPAKECTCWCGIHSADLGYPYASSQVVYCQSGQLGIITSNWLTSLCNLKVVRAPTLRT